MTMTEVVCVQNFRYAFDERYCIELDGSQK